MSSDQLKSVDPSDHIAALTAAFTSFKYVAPEGIRDLQVQVANALNQLAHCAGLHVKVRPPALVLLADGELEKIASANGRHSALVRLAAEAQMKKDAELLGVST